MVAGADMVMAGGLFASCVDSPATVIEINGEFHKLILVQQVMKTKNIAITSKANLIKSKIME